MNSFKENCVNLNYLSRIYYSRIFTERSLVNFITKLDEIIKFNGSLIIIDSIHFLLKDLSGNDPARPRFIAKLGMKMNEIAEKKNLCFILINNYSNSMKPILGESWGCFISKRLELENNTFL